MKLNLKKLILPASLFVAIQSHALGLGSIRVDSSLDEVLRAEIPLILGSGETVNNIKVKLASAKEYEKIGLDIDFVPSNIRLSVSPDSKSISLTSVGAISEPIVSLLLVVDWKNGKLLREYTLLLDPPLLNSGSQPQIQTTNIKQNDFSDTVVSDETPEAQTYNNDSFANQTPTTNNTSDTSVVVRPGDTLWRIASNHSSGGLNPQQMMVAIFEKNPQAFSNSDMNQMRKGARLNIPSFNEASAISFQQALSEVKTQIQKRPSVGNSSSQTAGSDVDYGIEIKPPIRTSDTESDNVSNSSAEQLQETISELSQVNEDLMSTKAENNGLNDRVNELEKIVQDQKLALEMKSNDLAALQQQISLEQQGSVEQDLEVIDQDNLNSVDVDDSVEPVEMVDNETEVPDSNLTTDVGLENEDDVWDDDLEDGVDSELTNTENNNELMASEDSDQNNDSTLEVNDDSNVVVDEPEAETTQAVATRPARSESLIDKAMKYKTEGLIGLGTLGAALAGLFLYRRRQDEDSDETFLDSVNRDNIEDDSQETADEFISDNKDLFEDIPDEVEGIEDEATEIMEDDTVDDILENLEEDLNSEINELKDDLNLEDDVSLDRIEETENEVDSIFEETEDESSLLEDNKDTAPEIDEFDDFDLDFDTDDLELKDNAEEIASIDLDEIKEDAQDSILEIDDFVDEKAEGITDDIEDSFKEIEEEVLETTDDLSKELQEINSNIDLDIIEDTDVEAVEEKDDTDFSDDLDFEDFTLDLDDENSSDNEDDIDSDFDDKDIEPFELDMELEDDNESSEDEIELGDFDLDLGDDMSTTEIDEDINLEDVEEQDSMEDMSLDLDLDDILSDEDAVNTKLDLAKAYLEMGDVEGVKQMVSEVLEEGTEEQISMAQSLNDELKK